MKIFIHFKNAGSLIMMLFAAIALTVMPLPGFSQTEWVDDPNLDQVPSYLRNMQVRQQTDAPLSSVITIDNWDNFSLGVAFAESNMAANPLNPVWYFTAYNTNTAYHTEDGFSWVSTSPNFGTSMNGDPVVAYDSIGNLYYENMYGNIVGCKVIKSTDNGQTWGTPVTAISGNDKNWIACDQTAGPYANYVYCTMTNNGVGNFTRSTDHGATFTSTFQPSTQSLPGMMVCVGPFNNIQGGSVYVVTNGGSTFASTYTFYRSLDGGATFNLMSSKQFAGYVGTNVNNRHSVENMRTRPYPFIAADNSYGPNRGRLYCVYASNDPPGNGNKPDIWCRYSDDGGTNWSSAIKVNDDANTTNNHQWHPAIWCDKETGRLYAQWMDTRDCPTHDSALIYASYSDNGGVTWAANQMISNKKMKINCASCGGGGTPRYQGDYNGIVSNKKVAMAGWTDFRLNTFLSVTAYFPDFAMAIDHDNDTIYTPFDSAGFVVSIPEVKLYTDTVLLSGSVEPTPTSGSIAIHYPQGDMITTYPADKMAYVVVSGSVPTGLYQVSFSAASPNGTPVHKRTAWIRVLEGSGFMAVATANPSSICPGQTSQLNVNVIGGTPPFNFQWSPAGSLSNPNIANPLASPLTTTSYKVTVTDNAADVSIDSVTVNVISAPPTPGPITGPIEVCENETVNYSISDVPTATSYSWTVPATATITTGQNTTSITVLWQSDGGTVSVIAGNNCGSSTPSVTSVNVKLPPEDMTVINGPALVCANATAMYYVYSVNAETYTWTVPADVTILSGQNTDTIHVQWGPNPGDISVYAENECGMSATITKSIGLDVLPDPAGPITGKDTLCLNHTGYQYSIPEISNALNYVWALPAGFTIASGAGTNAITVDVSQSAISGTVSVYAENTCGAGTSSSKDLVVTDCAGIPGKELNANISLYPNPADKEIFIHIRGLEKQLDLFVLDVNGQVMQKSKLSNLSPDETRKIDLSGLAKGVYFIKLVNSNRVFLEKFVIR